MTSQQPVAVVTGASSGIGKAVALGLVAAGYAVVGTSRNAARASRYDGVTLLDLDVTSDESVSALVQEVIARFGRIDVLVNNAGIGSAGAGEELSVAQNQKVFDINVFGVVRMMNAVLPHMRSQGAARIINISSVAGLVPQPHMAAYVASKHALEGYSESVDHEVRAHGVRVLLIEPANTSTTFDSNMVRSETPLPIYARQVGAFDEIMAEAMTGGDDPATVAKVVVRAATDKRPKVRYPAGRRAKGVSVLRRLAPARAFDRQIRKLNKLAVI